MDERKANELDIGWGKYDWGSSDELIAALLTVKFRAQRMLSRLLFPSQNLLGMIWLTLDLQLYPEWPHRQCVGRYSEHDRGSPSAVTLVICSPPRIAVCNAWSSGGTALCRVGGATSQLDLPSLTPLSVAGCGYISWYCGAVVFEQIGCQSVSPGLALPTFLNNNTNRRKALSAGITNNPPPGPLTAARM